MQAHASFRREPRRATPEGMSSRERIDAAALSLLANHGYHGLSMQLLADEVGLHKSTLFHHYRSKAEIAERVVEQVMSRMVERVSPRLTRDPPSLEDFIETTGDLVDYFASEPDAAKLLLRVVLAPLDSPIQINRIDHPFNQLMTTLVSWFARARTARVIRWVRIRHTLLNIMGMMVFHPATAPRLEYLTGPTPFSDDERAHRREEMAIFLRGALSPVPDDPGHND
jgi:AcrR family transcriptional regulator